MNLDFLYNPYPSRRSTVFAQNGMVATSQPLAAQAGLMMLTKGGNAVDAAIATAACLTVVEPTSNGIGGDAFALVWIKDKLHGLNASGPAPKLLSGHDLIKKGHKEVPLFGWTPVTVPGAPAGWAELSTRFGKLPLTEVLAPAIGYAEKGFPVSPVISSLWQSRGIDNYNQFNDPIYKAWYDLFAPNGKAPTPGEIWRSPAMAKTLRLIAETNGKAFYTGEIAEKIDAHARKTDGFIRLEDLANYKPEWVDPISINYRGFDVWEIPPNGDGLVALMALNILKRFDFTDKDTVETYHRQMEAVKLAFTDGHKYIADPRSMNVTVKDLLSDAYAEERAREIGKVALSPTPGKPSKGGTVYLATADNEGNMVSFIQSNYWNFGSGIVVPDTGVALHCRGANFSLDENHVNFLEPGKKPFHTIIPGFMTKDNKPVGPFGVMGGFVQPQGHAQVVMSTVDFKLNPQAVLDAPRWQWTENRTIEVEHQFPEYIAEALERRGHKIVRTTGNTSMGRGQIIWKMENGVYMGATEPRTDGTVASY